jgi:3-hydroxymyristoyl/3-hydroxydecanoyl-(acyl carrier protein) dehydratase
MTFLFVDRITELVPARSARGYLAIAPQPLALPAWLVVESIGQLAAWVAIAHTDFRARPVAALAGEVVVRQPIEPAARLELSVQVDRCDANAVAYRGTACIAGEPVGRLARCVGPMLPMPEFDDPAAVRRRFELLRGDGAPPGDLTDAVAIPLRTVSLEGVRGRSRRAELRVPAAAPFFDDHFPRKPVFPATLLLESKRRLAASLAAEALRAPRASDLSQVGVRNVKVRAFTAPGQTLELLAEVRSLEPDRVDIAVTATANGMRVSSARFEIAPPVGAAP